MRKHFWGALLSLPLFLLNGCNSSDTATAPPPNTPSPIAVATTMPVGTPTPLTETPAGTESPGTPATPGQTPTPGAEKTPGTAKGPELKGALTPLPGATAPKLTEKVTVHFKTDAGDITMDVYPQAGPNAAKRFLELVKSGFYDNTPIFRVVPGFVAQFGINSKHADMQNKGIADEPSMFRTEKGSLAFAKAAMPNSASTQIFISYVDTTEALTPPHGNFTAFGKVTKGMDVVEKFKKVGDPQMGLDQGKLWSDTEGYLKSLPADQKPTMIVKAEVVEGKKK